MEGFVRLAAILFYIDSGCKSHHPGITNGQQRRSIWRAAKHFVKINGRLYYSSKGSKRLVIFNTEERDRVLMEVHDHKTTGGHPGWQRTASKVVQNYYWLSIYEDVKRWVNSCEQCQQHTKLDTAAPKLHPIIVKGPWKVLGVDIIEMHETKQHYNRVLTMTDLFTKWVMARPLTGKSGPEVALRITESLLEHGLPRRIITDRGREFVNDINASLLEAFGVGHSLTAAYHPQSNGQDERTNQNIKRHLAKYCNPEQDDWDIYLQSAVYSINTTKQRSTLVSPFFALYGVHPVSRADPEMQNADCGEFEIEIEEGEEVIRKRAALLSDIHGKVKERIEEAQRRQTGEFESRKSRGVSKFTIHEGDEVLMKSCKKPIKLGRAMTARWIGPFMVEAIKSNGMATIVEIEGIVMKRIQVHTRFLKPFVRRHGTQNASDVTAVAMEADMTADTADVTVQCSSLIEPDSNMEDDVSDQGIV